MDKKELLIKAKELKNKGKSKAEVKNILKGLYGYRESDNLFEYNKKESEYYQKEYKEFINFQNIIIDIFKNNNFNVKNVVKAEVIKNEFNFQYQYKGKPLTIQIRKDENGEYYYIRYDSFTYQYTNDYYGNFLDLVNLNISEEFIPMTYYLKWLCHGIVASPSSNNAGTPNVEGFEYYIISLIDKKTSTQDILDFFEDINYHCVKYNQY